MTCPNSDLNLYENQNQEKEENMQKKQKKCTPEQKHKMVELKAYELWQKAGSPMGRDQEFWYTAEVIVKNPEKQKVKC